MCNIEMNRTFLLVYACLVLLTVVQKVNSTKKSLQPINISDDNPLRDLQLNNYIADNEVDTSKLRVKRQNNNNNRGMQVLRRKSALKIAIMKSTISLVPAPGFGSGSPRANRLKGERPDAELYRYYPYPVPIPVLGIGGFGGGGFGPRGFGGRGFGPRGFGGRGFGGRGFGGRGVGGLGRGGFGGFGGGRGRG